MKPSELAGQEFYICVSERDQSSLSALQGGRDMGPMVGETYIKDATIERARNNATPSSPYGECVVAKCTILTQAELDILACPF